VVQPVPDNKLYNEEYPYLHLFVFDSIVPSQSLLWATKRVFLGFNRFLPAFLKMFD